MRKHFADKLADPRAQCFTCGRRGEPPWMILGQMDLRTHTMAVLCNSCTAVRLKGLDLVSSDTLTQSLAAKARAEEEAATYLAELRQALGEVEQLRARLVSAEGERDGAQGNVLILQQHIKESQKRAREQLRDAILDTTDDEKPPSKRAAKTAA
jgi:hypothetical protein